MGMESCQRFVFLLGDSWDSWWKGFMRFIKIILWYPNMKTESPPFCRWFSWTPPLPTLDFERIGANLQGHYDSFLKFSQVFSQKISMYQGCCHFFWVHDLVNDAGCKVPTFVSWESRLADWGWKNTSRPLAWRTSSLVFGLRMITLRSFHGTELENQWKSPFSIGKSP